MPKLWGKTTAFFKCTALLMQNKTNSSENFLEVSTLMQNVGGDRVAIFLSFSFPLPEHRGLGLAFRLCVVHAFAAIDSTPANSLDHKRKVNPTVLRNLCKNRISKRSFYSPGEAHPTKSSAAYSTDMTQSLSTSGGGIAN
jgi:hypothetical protein